MDFGVLEDWLYVADMYTGVWWYKAFLLGYYLTAFFVVRVIWRRAHATPASMRRRISWLLLAAALIAPSVVALGAGIVTPFPVGIYFFVGLATDGFVRVAAIELLISLVVLLAVWLLLIGCSVDLTRFSGRVVVTV
jgi:hypothetical protein